MLRVHAAEKTEREFAMKPFEYINRTYGVNACVGRRVVMSGNRPGTIIRDWGHYIGVNFDADKPGKDLPCHPTSEMVYLDEVVGPRKPTRSQRRYQEYLESEVNESFAWWLGVKGAR
jgi:hypothetical protein